MRVGAFLVVAALMTTGAQAASPAPGLTGTDCSQFLDSAEMAAVKKPVPGAQTRAVEAARDELIITMFWVHGFETAKTGTLSKLDQTWLQDRITRLARICKAKGAASMPISAAVAKL